MNSLFPFVPEATLQALGWTLVHFLWQGIVVFLLLESSMQFVRLRSAHVRYVTSCLALLLMLLLPLATFRAELRSAQQRPGQRPDAESSGPLRPVQLVAHEPIAARDASSRDTEGDAIHEHAGPLPERTRTTAPGDASPPQLESHRQAERARVAWSTRVDAFLVRVEALLPWLVAAWFAGVLLLMLRLIAGWTQAQRLRLQGLRSAPRALELAVELLGHRLGVRQAVRVCESALAEVPTVVGWLKPIVLIPTSALAGLPPQQLEAILAHELAHVRRHDYVVNLMQTVVETLLFYHPAVWWISERIREEREHCCDDLAIQACGDRFGYVRALTALEELRVQPSALGVAMAAAGGSLLARVQRLVGRREAKAASPARGAAGLLAVAMVFVLGVGMQRAGEAGAETEPWNSQPASASTTSESPAARSASPSDVSSEPENVLGQRSARKGEAQPAWQLRGPARSSPQSPREAPAESSQSLEPRLSRAPAARLSVRELLALRQAGVDGDYVAQMQALGVENLGQLIRLRQAGVEAAFVRDMREAGFHELEPVDAIALRQHGVDASFVRAMGEAGFDHLDLDELLTLRQVGVEPNYMRLMRQATGVDLDLEDFVALRLQGVDPGYVESMRRTWEHLDIDELVELRIHGVDPAWVESLHEAWPEHLDADELIALRQCGVDPGWVRALHEAGLKDLDVEDLIDLRRRGANASNWRALQEDMCPDESNDCDAYVATMHALGLEDVGVDDLVELHRSGVDARYVERMVDAGLEPSLEVLIHLRQNGVEPRHIQAIRDGDAAALTVNDLVKLKNAGIDGDVLDRLQEAKR
jgi:beta-lactamase regulating signal transducer with metallopeptidase domain